MCVCVCVRVHAKSALTLRHAAAVAATEFAGLALANSDVTESCHDDARSHTHTQWVSALSE